jgi:hypothetical protein
MNRYKQLTQPEFGLLQTAVREHAPQLTRLLSDAVGRRPLSINEREALREAVADELMARGIDSHGGITEYGVALDDLIDRLAHISEPE